MCPDSFTRPASPFIYRSIVAANIASRRVANKPSFGGRDLHRCRRYERDGEKEQERKGRLYTRTVYTRVYLRSAPTTAMYASLYIYV